MEAGRENPAFPQEKVEKELKKELNKLENADKK